MILALPYFHSRLEGTDVFIYEPIKWDHVVRPNPPIYPLNNEAPIFLSLC